MEVFAWGANSHGQLGLGSRTEFEAPKKIITRCVISQICAGGGHSFILHEDGSLAGTGWNNKGQRGIESKINLFIPNSSIMLLPKNCCKISCGWDTSAAITTDNELFVWGSNSHGQLGVDSKFKVLSEPTELLLPGIEGVVDIQFGLRHSVILTTSGKVVILGSLKYFRNCGHQFIHKNLTFHQLLLPKKVTQIASGQNHILVLSEDNSLQAFGDNKFGQCAEVKSEQKIVKIACGWTHNAFLTEAKELFLYGRNNYGQLGDGSRENKDSPQKLCISPVDDFQLGAEHGILKSNDEIFTWGWNEHGNCGNGSFEDVLKPEKVQLPDTDGKLVSVVAGSGYCMALYRVTEACANIAWNKMLQRKGLNSC